MNNQLWLELIKKGDQTAFRELVEHYRPLVYRTVARFVTNSDSSTLKSKPDKDAISIAGVVSSLSERLTKKKDVMCNIV
ncbi:MAG: hypothetical protein CVU06_06480, partial [Bacteroidetes bacterium HGW-Bacteroidetes-22]